jgi:hypothetical protein
LANSSSRPASALGLNQGSDTNPGPPPVIDLAEDLVGRPTFTNTPLYVKLPPVHHKTMVIPDPLTESSECSQTIHIANRVDVHGNSVVHGDESMVSELQIPQSPVPDPGPGLGEPEVQEKQPDFLWLESQPIPPDKQFY